MQRILKTTPTLALLFVLSACGGSSGGDDNPLAVTGEEPTTPVAGAPTPVTSPNPGGQPGVDTGANPGNNPGVDPAPVTNPEPVVTPPAQPVAALTLEPLPNPPLTENPSANDEPIPQLPVFNTLTDFQAVREPSPRVEKNPEAEISEAEFAAGLPAAVITVPPGVDPSQNGAPFFEGLSNVRVEAGAVVDIRYVPRDPEGDLPGQFPQELPPGATFEDNFDGTRSLRWQTFQDDIGINAFTAVAVDPAEPQYRSSQTILIAVDEPSDPSSVPNVAPAIRGLPDYTVRVGDPAAIIIDGFDRNGTTPFIELVDPPPGATLSPDERDAGIYILRVVPEEVGLLVLNVLSRDEIDPTLTGLNQINLTVLPAADFIRPGNRLRDVAEGGSVLFGSALSPVFYLQADGGIYEEFASSEFAIMTPESSMKWDAINPAPGLFQWSDMDNLMVFAERNDMVVRGHPLVWHRSLPPWVEATAPEDRIEHMREFMSRVMNRYADRINIWDVINEPMNDADGNLRQSLWYEDMGEDYIDIAFLQARQLDPTATLVLNEFDIGFAGPKFDGFLALVDRMQARNVPFDAVGFQMHVFSSFDQFDELANNMAAMADRGLDIHITELDVALVNGDSLDTQANVFARVVETCKAQPRCTVLQTWGFTDRYSFRTFQDPLYINRNHGTKPAYEALQQALGAR